jgi:hypothetical protein
MIKTYAKAVKVQNKRFASGKRDVAKAVRRWYMRYVGEAYKPDQAFKFDERKRVES